MNNELIFEVVQTAEGGFNASCLNADIDTIAATLQELHDNITRAVEGYFPEGNRPLAKDIHLMLYQE